MDQQPAPQAYQSPTEPTTPVAANADKKRKKIALWLLIGPSALFVATIALYAIVNMIMNTIVADPSSSAPFGEQSILQSIINIIMYLVGIVVFLTWLPGIIIGIILLASKKKV